MTPSSSSPFDGVPEILRANLERRGFTQLTEIQRAVVERRCEGRNLRLSSQTGSGKTVALGLGLYPSLLPTGSRRGPRALIIAPTRELANQVRGELAWLFEGCPSVKVEVVTGGTDVRSERRRLSDLPMVVVGTPGRLLDHARSGALDLSGVTEVVLDEADQMLDMGFKDELDALLELLPEERRSHLVSATFPGAVLALARRFQHDPVLLEGTALGVANADIEHVAHLVVERERYAALVNILLQNSGQRCLVFVQRRVDTATVAEMLLRDGFTAAALSGELPQAQRDRTLASFKAGTVQILVATDVAARGLHVDDVALVVHADLPREAEVYTHRSGRTGRAGQHGRSVLLVVPQARRRIERLLEQAKIHFEWQAVPSPKQIRRAMNKQLRRDLHERLAQADKDASLLAPSELEYAAQLLGRGAPEQLVAVLLKMVEPSLPTQPREVHELPLHPLAGPARPRFAPKPVHPSKANYTAKPAHLAKPPAGSAGFTTKPSYGGKKRPPPSSTTNPRVTKPRKPAHQSPARPATAFGVKRRMVAASRTSS